MNNSIQKTLIIITLMIGSLFTYQQAHAQFLTSEGNIDSSLNISKFELLPKQNRDQIFNFDIPRSLFGSAKNIIFRSYGSAIIDNLFVFNQSRVKRLFAGFNQAVLPSYDLAELNVNGTMRIESLADPTSTTLDPVCTNDFGKLERCSSTASPNSPSPNSPVQSNGLCANFPGDYTSQPANTGNGCIAGTYEDNTSDSSTRWLWNCNGTGGGINDTCSATRQVSCTGSALVGTCAYSVSGPNWSSTVNVSTIDLQDCEDHRANNIASNPTYTFGSINFDSGDLQNFDCSENNPTSASACTSGYIRSQICSWQ